MGAKAGVQFTATGGAGSPGSSFTGGREEYAPTAGAQMGDVLNLDPIFTRLGGNPNEVVEEVNTWLRNQGLILIDKDYLGDNPSQIGFTSGGEQFGGVISRTGKLGDFKGSFGKIIYLDYGTESAHGGKNIDILWINSQGKLHFINKQSYINLTSRDHFVKVVDNNRADLQGRGRFYVQRPNGSVFAGSVTEGLKKINAPNELMNLCRSLGIIQ